MSLSCLKASFKCVVGQSRKNPLEPFRGRQNLTSGETEGAGSKFRRSRIGKSPQAVSTRVWLGLSCCLPLLALPLAASKSQETTTLSDSAEGESAAATEKLEAEEEREGKVERYLFPETSSARSRLGERTTLRSSDFTPPNVLQNVSRQGSLLRFGSFAFQPSLAISSSYDDNVNASDDERESEFGGNVSGSLRAQSLFDRHGLGVQVDAVVNPFNRNDGEELVDWSAGVDGQLDLTPKSSLSMAISGTFGTEDVESAEAIESVAATGDEATITDVAATVVYAQQLNRFDLSLSGGAGRIEADANGDDIADVVDERDSTNYNAGINLNYNLSQRLGLFGEAEYELTTFDVDGEGGSRDSQTANGVTGVEISIGRTLRAQFGVGYTAILFDDSERDTEQNVTAQAELNGAINLDRVTILDLSVSHETERTTVEDAALVTTTTVGGLISRALGRRSAAQLSIEGARADFINLDRTDYDVAGQLAYSFALTRSLSLNASYRYSQRFSDDDADEFYRNVIAIGLQASF